MVGSEGTLGVVTKATLKLLPLPQETRTMLALFNDLKDAASATAAIIKAKVVPSTLEIVDSVSLRCVEEYANAGLPKAGALLLIEVDGNSEAVRNEAEAVSGVCLDNGATDFRTARDKDEVKDLWKARRAISASLYRAKPHKINEDIVVPRSRIPDLVEGLNEISGKYNVLIASFGHAGDGNIHVNVMYDKKDPAEAKNANDAVVEIFKLTLALGGTISGEHGVGTAKMKYLEMELKQQAIESMKRIKAALDPKGVLNPGKIFPGEGTNVAPSGAVAN